MIQIETVEELLRYVAGFEILYLYGAGVYGKLLGVFLEQHNVIVSSFIVTETESKKKWRNIDISTLNEVSMCGKYAVIISTSAKNQREIFDALVERGVERIVILSEKIWKNIRSYIDIQKISHIPNEKLIQVLIFHRVSYKNNDPWRLEVSPDNFEEYIKVLSQHYPIIRFEEDWNRVEERSLVLTFDDGYYDNYKYALPILEKYNTPATIFVSTGNIGTGNEFWWDKLGRMLSADEARAVRKRVIRMTHEQREYEISKIEDELSVIGQILSDDRSMSESEIKSLDASGLITIGAHTVTHSMLSALSKAQQQAEIVVSKEYLEKIIEKTVNVFSYPFGGKESYNEDTIDILRTSGFIKSATNYSGIAGKECDMYEIPRCGIVGNDVVEVLDRINLNWILYA